MNAQFEYVEGQYRATFPALLSDFQRLSDAAALTATSLDVPYGEHPRQRFDHFAPTAPAQGVCLYFHAGYWQSRDKSLFRFLAPAFQQRGLHFLPVNYPLCPVVTIAELVQAVAQCLTAARGYLQAHGVADMPWVLAGHSAGAHLAASLALGRDSGVGVDGVLGISGVYELEPLLATTLNDKLQLDSLAAATASVVRDVRPSAPPACWLVGGAETQAFLDQNEAMHRAWVRAGNWSLAAVMHGADHFTVLPQVVENAFGLDGTSAAWWRAVQSAFDLRRQRPASSL